MSKTGKAFVTAISDGDTLTVWARGGALTVRVACIDAPELAQAPYGEIARDALTGLAPIGSRITIRSKGLDTYGRTVAEIFDQRRRNIGTEMVRTGNAFVYDEYASSCDKDQLTNVQDGARKAGLGIWSATGLQQPWEFRNSASRQPTATGKPDTSSKPESGSSIPVFTGQRVVTCSQINSKAEAASWLAAGHTYLDADGDGCACESQFPC